MAGRKVLKSTPEARAASKLRLEQLSLVLQDGEVEWTALDSYAFGDLVRAVVASDGGLMIRASEQRRSLAIGAFLGGQSQWTTCRNEREVLAVLDAAVSAFEGEALTFAVPSPTAKAKKRS